MLLLLLQCSFVTVTLSATIQSQFYIWKNKPIPFIAADRVLCSKLQLNRTSLTHLEQMVSPSTHEYWFGQPKQDVGALFRSAVQIYIVFFKDLDSPGVYLIFFLTIHC